MNVLLVEDDVDIGSMLSRGLKVEGFDVTTVERADQALDTARDINPCAPERTITSSSPSSSTNWWRGFAPTCCIAPAPRKSMSA
jgi:CheY-like chemotaxis protein